MAKTQKRLDIAEGQLRFDFSAVVDRFIEAKEELLSTAEHPPSAVAVESEAELCVEIAAGIKRAQREASMSREQLVDAVNSTLGRSEHAGRKPLSIHMLNHYLSKPTEYPIEAIYLLAIMVVTGSLEPARALVAPLGAQVISGAEVRHMQIGRIEETLAELQRLKREIKRR